MIYSDFSTAIYGALVIDQSSDTDFAAYLPRLIEQAELRCYRDLDLLAMRKSATVTLLAGTSTAPTPADWILGRHIWINPQVSTARKALLQRDEEFLLEYWPDPSVTNSANPPKYWTENVAGTLLFAPPCDQAYTAQLLYTFHPPTLSATNTSTVLTTVFPDLFLAAAMIAGAGYQKNFSATADDAQAPVSWEDDYQRRLAGARREEARRKGEGYFDMSATAPPTAATPPGGG